MFITIFAGFRLIMETLDVETPIYSALLDYANQRNHSFHTPGHKSGQLFKKIGWTDYIPKSFYGTDLSVSCPEIDSLHDPKASIRRSLDLAAKAFGAKRTYFVLGGTTMSNLVSIFSLFEPQDKAIISRNLHKSVWAGAILRQLNPAFVQTETGSIPLNVFSESIEDALKKNGDAKGVIVTSPTYEGVSANLKKISKIARSYQVPLMVDEAWGPHFHFSDKFPDSAMSVKADIATQSTHKILGSLSQTSMLHTNSRTLNSEKVNETYRFFTSTSPFYPFLASLDYIRALMQSRGKELVNESFKISEEIRQQIASMDGFSLVGEEAVEGTEFGLDHNKILVKTKNAFKKAELLKREHIVPEKCTEDTILFLVTIGDTFETANALCKSLKKIGRRRA